MTQKIDTRLTRWTAEFRDAATEAAYRRWNNRSAAARARLVGILIGVATLPHVYVLYLRLGDAAEFRLLLASRIGVLALACLLVFAAWRGVSHTTLDRLVLGTTAALISQILLLSLVAGPVLKILDVQFLLLLIFVYILSPSRLLYRVVPCLLLSLFFLGLVIWQIDLDSPERLSLIAWTIAANFLGFYSSLQSEQMRRREFAGRRALRGANTQLSTTNRDLDRARAQAERESRAKSAFLANVSHELRTPLNAINGFSEVMKDELFGPVGDPRYKGYVADIHDSGNYLLSLINDLLDLSKVEAGKLELQEGIVDIGALIADSQRFVQEDANRGGVRLLAEIEPALPKVWADERACRQILLNLLSNAVKFTPPGASVTTRAAIDPGGDMLLTVVDTGKGIAKAEVEKVLQPFGQGSEDAAAGPRGTGLGLPLADALAQAHGGILTLTSAPGIGTTVTVRLPAARIAAAGQKTNTHDRADNQALSPPSTAISAPVT